MTWNGETPSWQDVVGALRAAVDGGYASLDDPLGDEGMAGWGVPVPDEIRQIYRSVGMFRADGFEEFGPIRDSSYERCGVAGSYLLVHTNPAAETYYVDVDRDTGAWGPVFVFWENHGARLVAPSLQHWLMTIAGWTRYAARDAGWFDDDFEEAFTGWYFAELPDAYEGYPRDAPEVVARLAPDAVAEILGVEDARRSDDPALAAVGARLPDGAVLADLRAADRPTRLPFDRHPTWPGAREAVYQRFLNGGVIAATPLGR